MTINISKEDLIVLIMGSFPHQSLFENERIKGLGENTSGYSIGWIWYDEKLADLSEEELWGLYNQCKLSWTSSLI